MLPAPHNLAAIALLAIAALLTLWSLFISDRARGRLRCPRCWYDLSAQSRGVDAGRETPTAPAYEAQSLGLQSVRSSSLRSDDPDARPSKVVRSHAEGGAGETPTPHQQSTPAPLPTLPITCPECAKHITRPRQLRRTRRRKRWLIPGALLAIAAYPVHHIPEIRARGYPAAIPSTILVLAYPHLDRIPDPVGHSLLSDLILQRFYLGTLAPWQIDHVIDAAINALPDDPAKRASEWDWLHETTIDVALREELIDINRLVPHAYRLIWFEAQRRPKLAPGELIRAYVIPKTAFHELGFDAPIMVTIHPDVSDAEPIYLASEVVYHSRYLAHVPKHRNSLMGGWAEALLSSDEDNDGRATLTYTIDELKTDSWRRIAEGTWNIAFERTDSPTLIPVAEPDIRAALESNPAIIKWYEPGERLTSTVLAIRVPDDPDLLPDAGNPTFAGTLFIVADGKVLHEEPMNWNATHPIMVKYGRPNIQNPWLYRCAMDFPDDAWPVALAASETFLRFTPDPELALEEPLADHYWATPLEWRLEWISAEDP